MKVSEALCSHNTVSLEFHFNPQAIMSDMVFALFSETLHRVQQAEGFPPLPDTDFSSLFSELLCFRESILLTVPLVFTQILMLSEELHFIHIYKCSKPH